MTDRFSGPALKAARTIDKIESATKKTDSAISRAGVSGRNSFNNINNSAEKARSGIGKVVTAIGGIAAGLGTAIGAAKVLEATIGEAAKYQQSAVLVEAMFDDKKLSKQYNAMVQKLAEKSPIMNTSDMMGSSKAFIGITKSMPELEKAWKIAEKLSIMDPEQGLQGAVYAMKELASGDGVSMAERFEMPKSVVNSIKNLSFDKQLAAMQEYLDKTGITNKTVAKMGDTTISKWNQVKERMSSVFRNMGTNGNSGIAKSLDGVLAKINSPAFDKFAQDMNVKIGGAITSATDKAIKFASFVQTHWSTITTVVKAVAVSFIALKGISVLIGVISGVTSVVRTGITVFNGLRKAFALVRLSMLLFPGSWIIVAIGAVIAIAILLYKHWDTVKAKTMQLWEALGGIKGVVRIMTGPLGVIIGAAIDLAKNWDSTKSVWENVWGAMKRSAAETVNSVIGGINEMIKVINKIPGVNIPVIARVDWGNQAAADAKATATTIGNGGHAVQGFDAGLDYVRPSQMLARLHHGERVLTREENKAYSDGMGTGAISITGNTFHVRQESDIESIAKALATQIYSAAGRGA
ncbi:hypothetical protein ACWV26_17715 [Rummeliibacillus sp. JY-2-4R]